MAKNTRVTGVRDQTYRLVGGFNPVFVAMPLFLSTNQLARGGAPKMIPISKLRPCHWAKQTWVSFEMTNVQSPPQSSRSAANAPQLD